MLTTVTPRSVMLAQKNTVMQICRQQQQHQQRSSGGYSHDTVSHVPFHHTAQQRDENQCHALQRDAGKQEHMLLLQNCRSHLLLPRHCCCCNWEQLQMLPPLPIAAASTLLSPAAAAASLPLSPAAAVYAYHIASYAPSPNSPLPKPVHQSNLLLRARSLPCFFIVPVGVLLLTTAAAAHLTCSSRIRRASILLIAVQAMRPSTAHSTSRYISANVADMSVENSGNRHTAQLGLPGSKGHITFATDADAAKNLYMSSSL